MKWLQRPVLQGSLVRLEPLDPSHAEGVQAAADDESVFAHTREGRPTSASDAADFIASRLEQYAAGNLVSWTQVDVRGDAPVVAGMTSYLYPDPELRTVEIGSTWLGTRFWRTGINVEAKLLLLARAFEDLDAVRVTWQTDIRNERSQQALAGLGAVREGVLRKNRTRKNGEWRDSVLYSVTDDEWPAIKATLTERLGRYR